MISHDQPTGSGFRWGCVVFVCIALLVTAAVSFTVGGIVGQSALQHSWGENQAKQIRAALDQHTDRFSDVTIGFESDYAPFLAGTVTTQEDKDLLLEVMERAVGEQLARLLVHGIEVLPRNQANSN